MKSDFSIKTEFNIPKLLTIKNKRFSGIGWEVGGRFKREGTYGYLWLSHAVEWQKPSQH